MKKISDRDIVIFKQALSGKTFVSIGLLFGISAVRANQITRKVLCKIRRFKMKEEKKLRYKSKVAQISAYSHIGLIRKNKGLYLSALNRLAKK